MKATQQLEQKELAETLLITSRQVHNLVEAGMPRRAKAGKAFYQWGECLRWFVAEKEKRAAARIERKATNTDVLGRQTEAETRLLEIKLAKEEGQLVALDYMERQLTAILERVRAHLLNMPGKYAPALVGIRTIPEAQQRVEGMIAEVMATLTEIGDDPELDAPDDTPDRDSSLAA